MLFSSKNFLLKTTKFQFQSFLYFFLFRNSKQIEKRHTDGRTEIIFPDKTVKYVNTDGSEETVFTDGIIQNVDTSGVRTVLFPNGQKEVHTHLFKVWHGLQNRFIACCCC